MLGEPDEAVREAIAAEKDEVTLLATEAGAAAAAQRRSGWEDWVVEAVTNGASGGHAYLRGKAWRPAVVRRRGDGAETGRHDEVLAVYREAWKQHWVKEDGGRCDEVSSLLAAYPHGAPLPLLRPAALREASRSFKARTSRGADGLHVRHFALLSDAALHCAALLWDAIEVTGVFPRQLCHVGVPLIPKQEGRGLRPIGNLCALYRVAMKCRRVQLDAWERTIDRPFFAAQKGKGPGDLVWRAAVRAEAAQVQGRAFCAVNWDLVKMYEKLDHCYLIRQAAAFGMPGAIVRASIRAYRLPRFVSFLRACGGPILPNVGVVAGCTVASTWARLCVLGGLDRILPSLPGCISVAVYIDDFTISAQADTCREARRATLATAGSLAAFLEGELRGEVSAEKATVVANTAKLADDVRAGLGQRGGVAVRSAAMLGIDFSAGRRRRGARRSVAAARVRLSAARSRRLARVARGCRRGASALKLYITGIRPAATYGAAVCGVAPGQLLRQRRSASVAMRPAARGRSLTATSILHGDPSGRAGVAAIERWAAEVWAAAGGDSQCFSFGYLAATWYALRAYAVDASWSSARGPIGIAHLELARIGWEWTEPFAIHDAAGAAHCLLTRSPKAIAHALCLGNLHQLGNQLAHRDGASSLSPGTRVLYEPVLRFLAGRHADARGKGLVRNLFANGIWTRSRAADAGYAVSRLCELCGNDTGCEDTLHHRLWACQAPSARVARAAVQGVEATAARARAAGGGSPLFCHARAYHDCGAWPQPTDNGRVLFMLPNADGGLGEVDFEAWRVRAAQHERCYTDGSAFSHPCRGLARAGWAAVFTSDDGGLVAAVSAPVWDNLHQSSGCAEWNALCGVLQVICPRHHFL